MENSKLKDDMKKLRQSIAESTDFEGKGSSASKELMCKQYLPLVSLMHTSFLVLNKLTSLHWIKAIFREHRYAFLLF